MPDREDAAGARRGRHQHIAFLGGPGHGLLEEDVRAALEGGHADLGVQVIRRHDVDGVHVGAGEELAVVEMDGDAGDVAPLSAVASVRQAIAASRARGAFAMASAWWQPQAP